MESSLVIKVKYGDTLRRFNTNICENGKLGLSVDQLKEKMRSLFYLAVDDQFVITYTDTDGDDVTIVDDCDLDDVVLQRLNPVRMVLTLKTGQDSGVSSSSSIPTDSLGINQSIEQIQSSVENVVKTVPEPLRGVLLKITRDLAATTSAPVIKDIIRSASKISESFACEGAQKSDVETKHTVGGTSSGVDGFKSSVDADLKAKEVYSGVRLVPDLNQAPPPPAEFGAAVRSSDNCSKGKREIRCPMFANGGLSKDVKQYSGCPMARAPTSYRGDRVTQFKHFPSHSDSVEPVFHAGVRCDECCVHPITGPRFKSKVKHDYDLCSSCYQKSGSEADYVRIDSPMMYHHIMKALHRKHGGHGPRPQPYAQFKTVADLFLPAKPILPVNQVKLDSRFIIDVNVMDGTTMAPTTPFTKIWRMQNNGNVVWHVGTKLVWTDGDKFSNDVSVDLEIPPTGIPVEGEIDVAVDFVAPELPGEYVSYWRMSSASGQKFGQRVWVGIQVDASLDPLSGSFSQLNLNLLPQNNGQKTQHNLVVIDIDDETPLNNTFSSTNLYPTEAPVKTNTGKADDMQAAADSSLVIEPVTQAVSGKVPVEDDDQNQESQRAASETMGFASNEQDVNFPINDFLLVGDANSNGTAPLSVPSVSYPDVDSSKLEDGGAMPVSASSNEAKISPSPQAEVFNETEESLLRQLSEMGFSRVDLNREILRKNGYDMEKTVVDLMDISEWDPIMDELEEMGFSDKKKNAILLVKNKGSIKRVVIDLVAGNPLQ